MCSAYGSYTELFYPEKDVGKLCRFAHVSVNVFKFIIINQNWFSLKYDVIVRVWAFLKLDYNT